MRRMLGFAGLVLSVVLAGCEGKAEAAAGGSGGAGQSAGGVVEVKMVTDGRGSYFEPAEITVQRGDVVRFVLSSGIHNVSFPADKNASAAGLPTPSAFLQLPGEVYEVPVDFAPGSYTFQCDPHIAMGMVGKLVVN